MAIPLQICFLLFLPPMSYISLDNDASTFSQLSVVQGIV